MGAYGFQGFHYLDSVSGESWTIVVALRRVDTRTRSLGKMGRYGAGKQLFRHQFKQSVCCLAMRD